MARGLTTIDGSPGGAMRFLHFARVALAGVCFWIQATPSPAQSQQASPPPQGAIRVSVDRVDVGVIVTDAKGRFVEGLHREDFVVLDNGAPQPLTDFAAVDEPAQVLLLIEAGPAVYLLEAGHVQAADSLLSGLSPGDRVAVVKYAEAPAAIADFTPDKTAAAAAFDGLRFNLGFGSLNLSSSLSTVLDWLTNVKGKKTIVLLSTGVDTSPTDQWGGLLQRLKTSDVRILTVSLGGELRNPQNSRKKKTSPDRPAGGSQQFEEADQILKAIAGTTGGRAYFPVSAKEFASVYAEIAQLVRHEYSLAFTPSLRDGKIHSIEVRMSPVVSTNGSAPNYHVGHRQAYVAPPPDPQQ
jgi:Ca-activated chloride channel homolog